MVLRGVLRLKLIWSLLFVVLWITATTTHSHNVRGEGNDHNVKSRRSLKAGRQNYDYYEHEDGTLMIPAASFTTANGHVQLRNWTTLRDDEWPSVAMLDPGDWLSYDIDVAVTGVYTVTLTVSSPEGDGALQIWNSDDYQILALVDDMPVTGGWDRFATVNVPLYLMASSTMQLQFRVQETGFELLYFTVGWGESANEGSESQNDNDGHSHDSSHESASGDSHYSRDNGNSHRSKNEDQISFDPTLGGDNTDDPKLSPTHNPTWEPTSSPTLSPTNKPTREPTATPTVSPTADPTGEPTPTPTMAPSINPTLDPTTNPTLMVTTAPTVGPTQPLTSGPSMEPTPSPTVPLTHEPTAGPTPNPTLTVTPGPTAAPTSGPTLTITSEPTAGPTPNPTLTVTPEPTAGPTLCVTPETTAGPTLAPTTAPLTPEPTLEPTSNPTSPIVPPDLPTDLNPASSPVTSDDSVSPPATTDPASPTTTDSVSPPVTADSVSPPATTGSSSEVMPNATADSADDSLLFDTCPYLIYATDFCDMRGVQVIAPPPGVEMDIDGVGWLDVSDWLAYSIDLEEPGWYEISLHLSSPDGEGAVVLVDYATQEFLEIFSEFPATETWEEFTTVTRLIQLPVTSFRLQMRVVEDGWNLQWLCIEKSDAEIVSTAMPTKLPTSAPTQLPTHDPSVKPTSAPTVSPTATVTMMPTAKPTWMPTKAPTAKPIWSPTSKPTVAVDSSQEADPMYQTCPYLINAADFCDESGTQMGDTAGLDYIGWLDEGDWVAFNVELETEGPVKLSIRLASPTGEGGFAIKNYATKEMYQEITDLPMTGSWDGWTTVDTEVNFPGGYLRMEISVLGSGWILGWICIEEL